jgi:hypothetical protein
LHFYIKLLVRKFLKRLPSRFALLPFQELEDFGIDVTVDDVLHNLVMKEL